MVLSSHGDLPPEALLATGADRFTLSPSRGYYA